MATTPPFQSADQIRDAFRSNFGRNPEIIVRSPGRVSLLGAHIDYSEGWVMPAAIDRAIYLAAALSAEPHQLDLWAADLGERRSLDLANLPAPVPERDQAAHWSDYPAAVAWALSNHGHQPLGMQVAYGGNVPAGAGVSSSAAVEVAFLLAWREAMGLDLDRRTCALLGRRAENGYLGVASGVMDQFASLHGKAGHLIFLDCRDLSHQLLPVSENAAALVIDSGVRRQLAGSNYNDRPAECRQAVALLQPHLPTIKTLRDVTPNDLQKHLHRLPKNLQMRAQHAVDECQRVRHAAKLLEAGDLTTFGQLMRQSHESTRDLYQVSIPEIDLLCETAWATPGCWGARLMGGGFGGCIAALVEASAAQQVATAISDPFEQTYARRPTYFVSPLADGAQVIAQPHHSSEREGR